MDHRHTKLPLSAVAPGHGTFHERFELGRAYVASLTTENLPIAGVTPMVSSSAFWT